MLDTFRAHPGVVPFYNAERIQQILEYPHLLGHIMGKTLLTPMHSDWIWHLWGQPEGIDWVPAIWAHRGSYKTTALTEVGILWWLLFHPDDRIALVRETFTTAAESLRVIQRACKLPEIIHLFDCVQPERAPFKVLEDPFGSMLLSCKQTVTKEVSVQAHGVDQIKTGSHFDRIQMDDVVTRQSRLSKAVRDRVTDAVREITTNIIDPGKIVQHVGTPWQKEDAWQLTPPQIKVDCYQSGLLSADRIQILRKKTTPSLFAANYELKHVADDRNLFKDMQFSPWEGGRHLYVHAHLDAKYDGDHTCALTFAARRKDGKIQVFGKVFTENVKTRIDYILDQCVTFRVREIHNETNPDKGYTADLLGRKPTDDRPPLHVRTYQERMNKHAKIVSYLLEYWGELVFDPNSDDAYLAQILDYLEGQEPDDAPDSLASLLRQAFYPVDPDRGRHNVLNEW